MRTHLLLASTLIAGLYKADFTNAQNWRTTDSDGIVRITDGGGTALQVFGPDGNLIQSHPVVPPFLQSMGTVILQTPDNSNFYLSRVGATVHWQVSTESPPSSTLPGYLELDGKWYALGTGFVQAFYSPNDHLVDSTASNCTAAGAALPAGINPRVTLDVISPLGSKGLPFVEYVSEGGFRGQSGRVDRVAALASLDYRWQLRPFVAARIFVDATTVAPTLPKLSLEHLAWAAGFAIDLHSSQTAIGRVGIAASPDAVSLILVFGLADPGFGDRQHR